MPDRNQFTDQTNADLERQEAIGLAVIGASVIAIGVCFLLGVWFDARWFATAILPLLAAWIFSIGVNQVRAERARRSRTSQDSSIFR